MFVDNILNHHNIILDLHDLTVDLLEIGKSLRIAICSYDHTDIFGEKSWKPKRDICLFSLRFINKIVDSFEN